MNMVIFNKINKDIKKCGGVILTGDIQQFLLYKEVHWKHIYCKGTSL